MHRQTDPSRRLAFRHGFGISGDADEHPQDVTILLDDELPLATSSGGTPERACDDCRATGGRQMV
jgi:hypothetical protein